MGTTEAFISEGLTSAESVYDRRDHVVIKGEIRLFYYTPSFAAHVDSILYARVSGDTLALRQESDNLLQDCGFEYSALRAVNKRIKIIAAARDWDKVLGAER